MISREDIMELSNGTIAIDFVYAIHINFGRKIIIACCEN
ncbi:hypothetical protein CLERM_069 [Coxiella-like endosymbiont]|nr:hypothetical protein CLERM_069 [Coxiella-like endosymbiont]